MHACGTSHVLRSACVGGGWGWGWGNAVRCGGAGRTAVDARDGRLQLPSAATAGVGAVSAAASGAGWGKASQARPVCGSRPPVSCPHLVRVSPSGLSMCSKMALGVAVQGPPADGMRPCCQGLPSCSLQHTPNKGRGAPCGAAPSPSTPACGRMLAAAPAPAAQHAQPPVSRILAASPWAHASSRAGQAPPPRPAEFHYSGGKTTTTSKPGCKSYLSNQIS